MGTGSANWQRLSPLLDELLELESAARTRRLAELREEDLALAGELERLLALGEGRPEFLAESAVDNHLRHPQSGRMVGPYRLLRPLGEGGMGQVWLALRADGLYERRVALKLLRPGYASADLHQRFARERQILARLAHAHIARLLDAGISDEDQPFLALEFIEGAPITDYARKHQLALEDRLRLFMQVCDAVSHAHANLVVHRDLKPSNILVTAAGDVRLLDFGIAKLLDTGSHRGEITRLDSRAFTLHYAAPEQLRGEPVSTMTDVYALGVVLYEMLTARKPYQPSEATDAAWESAILEADPMRPSQALLRAAPDREDSAARPNPRLARQLAGDLDNIVLKALDKSPARRYASVEALSRDLHRFLEGHPVQARPASVGYRLGKYVQRQGLIIGSVTVVVLSLAGSLLLARWQANQALVQAARAQALQDFVISLFEADAPGTQGVDLRRLLAAGIGKARTELAAEPQSQAALLGLIARLYNGRGEHADALAALALQQAALERMSAEQAEPLRLEAAAQSGRALRALGRFSECRQAMEPWLPRAASHAAQQPALAAEFDSQLGRCLRLLGEHEAAEQRFRHALALRGTKDVEAEAENLTDLASLRADAGELDAAIAGMRQALQRLQTLGGERAPAVSIWRSLSVLYRERGDVPAAEGAAREALRIALALHGTDHPATAEVQRQLGAVLTDRGQFEEAAALIEQAHAATLARFTEPHPLLGASYNALGVIAFERGDLNSAERHLRHAVAIWEQSPTQATLPGGLVNLGRVLMAARRPAEAQPLFARALALRESQYGSRHPTVGTSLRFLGEAEAALGQTGQARIDLERGVALLREHYGPGHPQCGAAELSLARLLWRQGESERAAALAQAVSARYQGDDSEQVRLRWWSGALQAEAACRQGDTGTALSRLRALLAESGPGRPQAGSLRREVEAIAGACAGARARTSIAGG